MVREALEQTAGIIVAATSGAGRACCRQHLHDSVARTAAVAADVDRHLVHHPPIPHPMSLHRPPTPTAIRPVQVRIHEPPLVLIAIPYILRDHRPSIHARRIPLREVQGLLQCARVAGWSRWISVVQLNGTGVLSLAEVEVFNLP